MPEKKAFYITTPLYYVNAKPHIGHAYTNILCDAFARHRRFTGGEVFFMTGTDEHGSKLEKVAKEQGKSPKEYVDSIVPEFKSLWKLLGISYDYFIRTTDESHKKTVQNILRDLEQKGDIYKAEYKGWYCTPCESFWTELQLLEGKCPDCRREVQELSEENYFFKLSKYQDWLIQTIQGNETWIRPEMRKNEILGFLRQPLEDLCITRPRQRLSWGIDFPGSPEHVIYVWFDALINYISGVGYTLDNEKFKKYWPADVHVVGKDILRHHAVYWPIMLKACGIDLPQTILAHGWWTLAGAKVSKSSGNIVDPVALTAKYGVDAFRYFLLNEVTVGADGAYSEDLIAERYRTDLANDLGNLWFRVCTMLGKYFEGKIPAVKDDVEKGALLQSTYALYDSVTKAMENYNPRQALGGIWQVITQANQFIEEKKPWVIAKNPDAKETLALLLAELSECLAHIAVLLQAFMPQTAEKVLKRLGMPDHVACVSVSDFSKPYLKTGTAVERGEALFPRLDAE